MSQPDKIGRYTLEEQLELSGLGQYWRGTDLVTAETVLVQAIPLARLCEQKDRSELFQKLTEAQRKAAELSHTSIRKILGVSRTAEMLFVFHQWRVGQSLAALLGSGARSVPPERVAAILGEVAQALEAAHAQGQHYGRLSPLAIDLDPAGAYLVDFGLAPLLLEGSEKILGTLQQPEFLAPEQVSGKRADALTDGYALAVLAYVLLTGAPPFRGETQEELLDNIVYREAAAPETVDPGLHPNTSRVLLKALSKEPESRFQSPGLFTSSLAKTLVREEPAPAPSVPRQSPQPAVPEKRSRSRRMLDGLRAGGRRLLGLTEGEPVARQEKTLLLVAGASALLLGLSVLLYLLRPMSRVRERLELGQLEAAQTQLSRLRLRWEGDPEINLLSAELHFRLHAYEAAVTEFAEVLHADKELLREALVGPLLVRLFFARPADERALELARFALEGASWTEIGAQLGLGAADRAASFLHLLVLVGRQEDAEALATDLGRRLQQRPTTALAAALMPVAATTRSKELTLALARWLLGQGLLAEGTEMLRRCIALGSAEEVVPEQAELLMRSLERHPQSGELRAFLAEHLPMLEGMLRQRLEHPSPLVRLGALRVLEAAGADPKIALQRKLGWQLEEAKTFGESAGLEEGIAALRALEDTDLEIGVLLAGHALWRRDYARALALVGELLEEGPELLEDGSVGGMLLVLLAQARSEEGWLQAARGEAAAPLLALGVLAPEARLRERSAALLEKLGLRSSRTAQLLVELRDPRTEDRLAVAQALAAQPEPEAKNALRSLAIRTQDPWLCQRLQQLLER